MTPAAAFPDPSGDIEALLRDELAQGDRIRTSAAPVLRHLLRDDDRAVFSEQTIARVRGIVRHIAVELLDAAASDARAIPGAERVEALIASLIDIPALVGHVHALALEWQLTDALNARAAIDPVLTALLQARIASADARQSATAMLLLASQARFMQQVGRMEYPVTELPGDLFHLALLALRAGAAHDHAADARAAAGEQELRASYDERRTRLALIEQVLGAVFDEGVHGPAASALAVDQAGVALFLGALALGSGVDRDEATFATTDSQLGRFALLLCASGVRGEAIAAQIIALHPDVTVPDGLDALHPDRAAALLAEAAARGS